MNQKIIDAIDPLSTPISAERQGTLNDLVIYIQKKVDLNEAIRLNFICTHNSRRSHLSQIWAQTMAFYFGIKNVTCYSGGTESTAMYPKVIDTLTDQGFEVLQLSETSNPVYAIKYAKNELPIICFSKCYDDAFNPNSHYGAVMTCNHADEACPFAIGAEARFSITYDDPKLFDGTEIQSQKYAERSLEIAQEMKWVFGSIRCG
jgi:arsenate reductase